MIKSELYASALAKAKVAFNAMNDAALARVLQIDPSVICKSNKNNTIPARPLIEACVDKNVSLDFIFGIKPEKKTNGADCN